MRAEESELYAGADEERRRADDDVLHVHGLREAVEGAFQSLFFIGSRCACGVDALRSVFVRELGYHGVGNYSRVSYW